jgi:ERCC4-type nuclease
LQHCEHEVHQNHKIKISLTSLVFMIVIDQREKNSLLISDLIEKQAQIELKHLEIGDYIIGDIAIERKTLNDFISSMLSKRLIIQLQNLKQFPKQLLILEGEEKQRINVHPNAIRGMLLSIMLDFNIPVVFSKTYQETADFLILLDKRQNKPPKEISLIAKRIGHTLQEKQQIILESFPGIGPTTAKALLKEFKTIKQIVNSKEKELEKQLDKNKIDEMKRILEFPYPD